MDTVLTRGQLIAEIVALHKQMTLRRPNRTGQVIARTDEDILFSQMLVLLPTSALQSLRASLRYLITSKEGNSGMAR